MFLREENGNPLQYSCLKNPIDRGAYGLQSMRSRRVRHNWVTVTSLHVPQAHRTQHLSFSSETWDNSIYLTDLSWGLNGMMLNPVPGIQKAFSKYQSLLFLLLLLLMVPFLSKINTNLRKVMPNLRIRYKYSCRRCLFAKFKGKGDGILISLALTLEKKIKKNIRRTYVSPQMLVIFK